MGLSFKELGFKPGDTVRCTHTEDPGWYKVGDTYVLNKRCLAITPEGLMGGIYGNWELVESGEPSALP